MDARFRVERTLVIPSRPRFFLLGDVTEGEVRLGMIAESRGHGPSFCRPVDAIEFVDERVGGRSWTALGSRYRDTAELRQWMGLDWADAVLHIPGAPILHPCPCCGFRTLAEAERGSYDLCEICDWEDDGVQYRDPDYRGGANRESLNKARAAFARAHPYLQRSGHD